MTHLSPLRYPGGKSRMLGTILPAIGAGGTYHDVFVGGGSVLLAVASQDPGRRLRANDADPSVAALWSLLAEAPDLEVRELEDRLRIPATLERFDAERARSIVGMSRAELAFRCIFFSRTTYGGISYASPIGGRSQAGRWKVDYHWNPEGTIARLRLARILLIGRTTVSNLDGSSYLQVVEPNDVAYLDPPYYRAGSRLYSVKFPASSARELANRLAVARFRWVLSYDDHPDVRSWYSWAEMTEVPTSYSSATAYSRRWSDRRELLIRPGTRDAPVLEHNHQPS